MKPTGMSPLAHNIGRMGHYTAYSLAIAPWRGEVLYVADVLLASVFRP
jgi:hypothetical protein